MRWSWPRPGWFNQVIVTSNESHIRKIVNATGKRIRVENI